MKKENKYEYQETDDFNPYIWDMFKWFYGLSRYIINIILLVAGGGALYFLHLKGILPQRIEGILAFILVMLVLGLRVAFEWERVPVLRLGKYIFTGGPGVFFIIPIIDKVIGYVDCRIMVTDFSAEKVLTADTVPVYVDAIIFWMVWDAAKARLEVEQYKRAVALSAKTALRDTIGKNKLSRLLKDRTGIGKQLQKVLDHKTNPWGITSLSVEIKDIVIPSALEDAMSREAQAEREKNARVLLSSAEIEISESYSKASKNYKDNKEAMELRALNILMDTLRKSGSMILVPSDIPSLMNTGITAGIAKKIIDKEIKKEEE